MKEEALRKSELMLEEDAIRFDAFLKENDKQAHEALKNAEKEAKLKADKVCCASILRMRCRAQCFPGPRNQEAEACDLTCSRREK